MCGGYTSTMFDLTGKIAIVTGVSTGLGLQLARALATQGAKLAILAAQENELRSVKEEMEKIGTVCIAIKCDLNNERLVNKAIEAIIEKCGTIDILVNNAGIADITPAEEMTMLQWDEIFNTNVRSIFMVSRAVGNYMIQKKYGKIINISSIFGAIASRKFTIAHYIASKHSVVGLTKALAVEWAKYNITVNAIGPGFFASEMTQEEMDTKQFKEDINSFCPMQRLGKNGELDGALIYLASDASSYTTGHVLMVDGGWTTV
ncbi:SDR family oxidoreductase [soil metagenome]